MGAGKAKGGAKKRNERRYASAVMKKRRKGQKLRSRHRDREEGSYVCPTCGEWIVIPLDPSAGAEQTYVEDCPVCCNPNVVHVEIDPAWESPRVWAEAE
jgi:hypothetical protein